MGFLSDLSKMFQEMELKTRLDETLAGEVNKAVLGLGWRLNSAESRDFYKETCQKRYKTRSSGHRYYHEGSAWSKMEGGLHGFTYTVHGPAGIQFQRDFFPSRPRGGRRHKGFQMDMDNMFVNPGVQSFEGGFDDIDDEDDLDFDNDFELDEDDEFTTASLDYGGYNLPVSAKGAAAVYRFNYEALDRKQVNLEIYTIYNTFSQEDFIFRLFVNGAEAGVLSGKEYIGVADGAIRLYEQDKLKEEVKKMLSPFAMVEPPRTAVRCPACHAPGEVNSLTGKGRCEYCGSDISIEPKQGVPPSAPPQDNPQDKAPSPVVQAVQAKSTAADVKGGPLTSQDMGKPHDINSASVELSQAINKFTEGILATTMGSMGGMGRGIYGGPPGGSPPGSSPGGYNKMPKEQRPMESSGYCPYCRSPIQPGWQRCYNCGNILQPISSPISSLPPPPCPPHASLLNSARYCSSCRAPVEAGWRVCPVCGATLSL